MQQGYTYKLTAPLGKDFDTNFKPELTPKQMLELGVFGGKYMTDCRDEFPKEWFEHAKLCHERHDPELNYFGVNASQPLWVWVRMGWINPIDPRGGFNGIAVIIWADAASLVLSSAVENNARRSCTGHMTAENCNAIDGTEPSWTNRAYWKG